MNICQNLRYFKDSDNSEILPDLEKMESTTIQPVVLKQKKKSDYF